MSIQALSQDIRTDTIIYKENDSTSLMAKILSPPFMDKTKMYPAMIFFSVGSWDYGNLYHFARQAAYFTERGIICILAEYGNKNNPTDSVLLTNILRSIADTRSCIRYFKKNADQFNIDTNKVIAAGGSAGGYLALMTALPCCDDQTDNLSISAKPSALVLFNPAVDFGPGDPIIFQVVGSRFKELSPLHNILPGMPPSIIMQGTDDWHTPVVTLEYFKHEIESAGGRCDLFLYKNQRRQQFKN